MKGNMGNRRGITLTELVLVLAIVAVLTAAIYSLFVFGNRSFSLSNRQFDVQNEVRIAMDALIREIRFAIALEIVSAEEAGDSARYEEGYSYFYISGGKLYNAKYDEGSGNYTTSFYSGHLDEGLSGFTRLSPGLLRISLVSRYKGQSHSGETDLKLMNFGFSGAEIVGSRGLGLKYKSNPDD